MSRPKSAQFKGTGRAFAIRSTEKTMRNVAKAIQQRLTAEKDAEHEEKKKKMEEKRKRKAENEFKSASFQTISDPATLKKMNKKQLRQVKKMRVNEAGVPEFVPAYTK